MRKSSSVIGLRVIGQEDGTFLGEVQDLVFDQQSGDVLALFLSEQNLFGIVDAQVVPWSQILMIGRDAVMVRSSRSKMNASDDARLGAAGAQRQTVTSGTRIFTTDGREIGKLADMFIDEATGHIVGYEVSGGFVSDTRAGRRFLPAPDEMRIGKDVVLVPPEAAQQMRDPEPAGGLRGGVSSLGQQVGGAMEATRARAEGIVSGNERLSNFRTNMQERAVAAAIGKPTGRAVLAPDGSLLLAHGDIITEEALERARAVGKESDVLAAAGLGAAAQGVEAVREGASGLWGALRQKAAELTGAELTPTDEAAVQAEQEKINRALGCPVNRPIADHFDQIILRTGELVTPVAVERAREAGLLDVLLKSVVYPTAPPPAATAPPAPEFDPFVSPSAGASVINPGAGDAGGPPTGV